MKFKVDYAKSGFSTCRGCESKQIANNKIAKGTLRIGLVEQADRFDSSYELWHHIDCLFDVNVTKTPSSLDSVEGIQRIRFVDQLSIIQKINKVKNTVSDSEIPTKRFKSNFDVDSSDLAIIATQNEQYYRIYDTMNQKNCAVPERKKKAMLQDILDVNNQAKPYYKDSTQAFLEHVVDIITFGAMESCSKCSTGGYIFDGTYGYVCNRRFYDQGGVKCNNRKKAPQRSECIIPDDVKDIYPILHEHRQPTERILYNLEPPENTSAKLVANSTATNDADQVTTEVDGPTIATPTKVASSKQILKYGTVVDSLSGIEDVAHVYTSDGVAFGVILSKTNIQDNKNGFYKIQLLESDDDEKYWVFTHFGRIGCDGTHKLMQCNSLKDALNTFDDIYIKQTGHSFGFELDDIPYKFVKLDIDYSDEVDSAKLMTNNTIPSELPDSVQKLMELCFDTHNMKDTMIELELDVEKIPLGKLSKHQIEKGSEILLSVYDALERGASEMEFMALSNRFYTMIPHDYGSERPPVINSLHPISEKFQMLSNLSDIQLAYSLLSTENDITRCPIDNCYEKLKADIEPLERSSEQFKFLEQYVVNTHAPTHNFKLEVEEIFKISRNGEATRYAPFQNIANRYLLWHGSKITNFVGILTKGLKIAPPQATRTGDMFGNGIYFSDTVTKSAQYCSAYSKNRHGLLLLCEVALGEMENRLEGFTSSTVTPNKSVKGCGQTYPNPDGNVVRDGVIVPCGKRLTDFRIQSELKYNEYVVYDESKVNIKYLFKVKFQRKIREN